MCRFEASAVRWSAELVSDVDVVLYLRCDALARGGWTAADVLALSSGEDPVVTAWRENLAKPFPQRTDIVFTAREIKAVVERYPHLFRKQA